eukprot:sb/3479703/
MPRDLKLGACDCQVELQTILRGCDGEEVLGEKMGPPEHGKIPVDLTLTVPRVKMRLKLKHLITNCGLRSNCLGCHSNYLGYHSNCFGYHSNLRSYLSNQHRISQKVLFERKIYQEIQFSAGWQGA